jgi:hypothetical protein
MAKSLGKPFYDIIVYAFVGAALVLIVKNAAGFSQAFTSVSGAVTNETVVLSGGSLQSAPQKSK